jgi:hypothetical protein
MTVRELLELLGKLDPEALVVLAADEEGNGFAPLAAAEAVAYHTDEEEVRLRGPLTDELQGQGYGEEDVIDAPGNGWVWAVALWP